MPVYRPKMRETTALGAAIVAGLAFGLWRNFAELRDINRAGGAVFEPQITRGESASKFAEWEKAVQMSRGWIRNSDASESTSTSKPTSQDPKPNGMAPASKEKSLSPKPSGSKTPEHPSLVADMVKNNPNTIPAVKVTTMTANGDIEFPPAKTPLVSISGDLDDADEEDLFLELRKVEILQRLKKLRKLSYY